MYNQQQFLDALRRFTRVLVSPYEAETAIHELVGSVTGVLDVSGAGVTLASANHLRYVDSLGSLNPLVEQLERCQEREKSGPCYDAYLSGDIVVATDITEHLARWPTYATMAAEQGIRSVAGIPMQIGDEHVGALNIYSTDIHTWTKSELDVAAVLADMATGYLVNASKIRQHEELAAQLQRALDSRVIIEQAKGVLANQRKITPDAAFAEMRKHSRRLGLKLHDVAERVVRFDLKI